MKVDFVAGKVKEAMAEASAGRRDLWQVPVAQLVVADGFNVRTKNEEHKAHIASLKQSILQNGFLSHKPLAGFVAAKDGKNIVVITDGHCRFEAVLAAIADGAQIEELPVVVSPKGTNEEDLVVGLIASNSGKPLSPLEKAAVCKRLVGFGWDEEKIAARLSMTVEYVGSLLLLISASAGVRGLVERDQVSATTAITALKKHKEKAGEVLLAGVAAAKSSGKGKATAKDLAGSKPSSKQVLKEALMWFNTTKGIKDMPEWVSRAKEVLQ